MSKQLLQLALDALNVSHAGIRYEDRELYLMARDKLEEELARLESVEDMARKTETLPGFLEEAFAELPRYRGVSQEEYDAMTPRQKQFMDTWT
jgi:hypothetical protein